MVTTSVELPVMATEVNREVVETEVVETEAVETEVVETEVVETELVETEVIETEVVETEETTEAETDSWDGVTEESVYEADNYTVTFKLTGAWDGGYNANVRIDNTGDTPIESWKMAVSYDGNISNIWNAVIESYEENHYVVRNAGDNQNIAAGESVSFGFNVTDGSSENTFTNFVLTQYSDEEVAIPEQDEEPLVDIGEIYFKDIEDENDIAYNADNGMPYVKNQLLISGLEGADKEVFEAIIKDCGAEIVGYIQLTNDYQIEFATGMTWEELENKRKYLESFSFVESVTPNVVIFSEESATTNDAIYNIKAEGEGYNAEYEKDGLWNEALPYGYNWSLEAMRVPSAWDILETVDNPNPVKMGFIEFGFDEEHRDLPKIRKFGDNSHSDKHHGTHVVGIMAAKHNNGIGISGVATNVKLYGYANGSCNRQIDLARFCRRISKRISCVVSN